ncbi:MAG: DUF368 domain-containing protein [Lachnospiraceae bacterium]|nr:DUF368 domain-containing protein [Lachnospiraceae bacterium]
MLSWFFRLIKGFIIGTGFIIPGVSGGVFAAIFGVYEPMVKFLGNITKNFSNNFKFFLPIGIGGMISIVFVSRVLGDFFRLAQVPLTWFFIGCVLGTLPYLYKKAGEQGRESKHLLILLLSCVMMFVLLIFMQDILKIAKIPTESLVTWLLAGVLMALGAIVPGLSPSNFLLYMGIYGVMMERIGNIELHVIVPILGGAFACILLLSKAFDALFLRAFAGMYHFIIGIIIASTLMVIPWSGKMLENGTRNNYDFSLVLTCFLTCVVGLGLGFLMSLLEKKIKTVDNLGDYG